MLSISVNRNKWLLLIGDLICFFCMTVIFKYAIIFFVYKRATVKVEPCIYRADRRKECNKKVERVAPWAWNKYGKKY